MVLSKTVWPPKTKLSLFLWLLRSFHWAKITKATQTDFSFRRSSLVRVCSSNSIINGYQHTYFKTAVLLQMWFKWCNNYDIWLLSSFNIAEEEGIRTQNINWRLLCFNTYLVLNCNQPFRDTYTLSTLSSLAFIDESSACIILSLCVLQNTSKCKWALGDGEMRDIKKNLKKM